jgi:hypothetical protein
MFLGIRSSQWSAIRSGNSSRDLPWIILSRYGLPLSDTGLIQARCPVASTGRLLMVTAFEIVPLETVSETSSNASIGDLNGDGHLDIVLVKGRHWQLTSKVFLGDGKGHFAPGPPLPSNATKSYSGSLADMTKSGHLDIVLSNDAPDPKLVLVNDGMGHILHDTGPGGFTTWAAALICVAITPRQRLEPARASVDTATRLGSAEPLEGSRPATPREKVPIP